MEAEVLGAIGIGLVMAGASGMQVWSKVGKNRKYNGTHCMDHADLVKTVYEVKNDVSWLRKKSEEDRTHVLLDGILQHLTRNGK